MLSGVSVVGLVANDVFSFYVLQPETISEPMPPKLQHTLSLTKLIRPTSVASRAFLWHFYCCFQTNGLFGLI